MLGFQTLKLSKDKTEERKKFNLTLGQNLFSDRLIAYFYAITRQIKRKKEKLIFAIYAWLVY